MEYVTIGSEPVKFSRVGFGTGSSGYTGVNKQTKLTVKELADLLTYAYDKGINLWDTGYSYGTHPHMREALKQIPRDKIVIATKFTDSFGKDIEREDFPPKRKGNFHQPRCLMLNILCLDRMIESKGEMTPFPD